MGCSSITTVKMKKNLLTLTLLSFFLSSNVSFSETVSEQEHEFYERSKFWPLKVAVHKEVIGDKHGNLVRPGREWDFIRYQRGKVIVDMGHNGIFDFLPMETDLSERMTENQQTRTFPFRGLFTFRFTKWFFDPSTLKGYQLGGPLEKFDYFILLDFKFDSSSQHVRKLGEVVSKSVITLNEKFDTGILLLPSEDIVSEGTVDEYLELGFNAPTIVSFLRAGMLHVLYHNSEQNGDILVVDKYGKVLGQFFFSDLGDNRTEEILLNTVRSLLSSGI